LQKLMRACENLCMSEAPTGVMVPEWDLADRMRKALRISGTGVQEMADYLGVARNTVSTWINGRIDPSTQTLRLWAMRCGVPYEWLLEGGLMFDKTSGASPQPCRANFGSGHHCRRQRGHPGPHECWCGASSATPADRCRSGLGLAA
jgi:DNA-binding transcriptional regulator YiaG